MFKTDVCTIQTATQPVFQQHALGSSGFAILDETRVRESAQHRFIDTASASSITRCLFTTSTCTASLHYLSLQLQCKKNQHIAHAVDTILRHSKTPSLMAAHKIHTPVQILLPRQRGHIRCHNCIQLVCLIFLF